MLKQLKSSIYCPDLEMSHFSSSCLKFITLRQIFFQDDQNFLQALRTNHFRYRHAVFSNQRIKEQRKNVRDRFLNFVTWSAEESDKVENYRFLQNYSMKFAENRGKQLVFNILSPPIIKNFKIGSENFPIFFDFTCADRQNFKKSIFSNFYFRVFDILS